MTNSEDLARGLKRPRASSPVAEVADWMNADAALLQKVISHAGAKHCALRFGYTRDGGAYSIGVYAGEQYFTDYVRPHESIDDYLGELLISFEEYDPGTAMPTGQERSKKRR